MVEVYACDTLCYLMKPVSADKLSETLSVFAGKQDLNYKIDLKNSGDSPVFRQFKIV